MAIFDTSYLALAVLGFVVFFAAHIFLSSLLKQGAGNKTATPVVKTAEPTASQRFIFARARCFNLPRSTLSRLAVVKPQPLVTFEQLDEPTQTILRDAYHGGHSRGPEATAFIFGEPLSEKNALYLAWFKDQELPHFFVDRLTELA
jgi:hypothetical protein